MIVRLGELREEVSRPRFVDLSEHPGHGITMEGVDLLQQCEDPSGEYRGIRNPRLAGIVAYFVIMTVAPARDHEYAHIEHDARGAALIAGTTMKVIELVMAQRAHGWSPEELSFQYPHLSMSQVHAALAYYWDHCSTLDAEIERTRGVAQDGRAEAALSPLMQRLSALKHRR